MLSMLCHALQRFASLALVIHRGTLVKQLLDMQWQREHTEAGSQGIWYDHDRLPVAGSELSQAVVLCVFLPS